MSWTRCLATLALLALCNCGMVTASSNTNAGGFASNGGAGPEGNSAPTVEHSHTEKVNELRAAANHAPTRPVSNTRCRHCN